MSHYLKNCNLIYWNCNSNVFLYQDIDLFKETVLFQQGVLCLRGSFHFWASFILLVGQIKHFMLLVGNGQIRRDFYVCEKPCSPPITFQWGLEVRQNKPICLFCLNWKKCKQVTVLREVTSEGCFIYSSLGSLWNFTESNSKIILGLDLDLDFSSIYLLPNNIYCKNLDQH